ncbi:MAG: single-stranded-DNA-specific exonuclease RecJ [Albidovulum sp.]|nr:single-stranded-DNA-specific exonuclease RecJ [Albidovulum sp.]
MKIESGSFDGFAGNERAESFLGVERSATGKRWIGPSIVSERSAVEIEQNTRLPGIICRVLASRNVSACDAKAYLEPKLRDLMSDPSNLLDMDRAVERFLHAVLSRRKIAIFADYDVDGTCSACMLSNWIEVMSLRPTVYIPDRLTEGYGPNPDAMAKLSAEHEMIICVDCGTTANDALAAAQRSEIIVLDHHTGGEFLPDSAAVVNPNRQDEESDLGYLSAAGVVFMFLVAANRQIRARGMTAPDILGSLDLVALATVADMAPLTGLNRALVRQGLTVARMRKRAGLRALTETAGVNSTLSAYHLGYVLGPRINAGGRIGKSDIGLKLLLTREAPQARFLAKQLEELNRERRDMTEIVIEEAQVQAESRAVDAPLVWAAKEGWHPGIVGIAAARLVQKFSRPAVVIAIDREQGKGSARSIRGIDLGAAVAICRTENLLVRGGGHAMAAGLTVEKDRIEEAMARIGQLLDRQGASEPRSATLRVQGAIMPSAISLDLINALEAVGPYGSGSPAPRFVLPSVRVKFAKTIKQKHLMLSLSDESGATIEAIAFRANESPLGPFLTDRKNGAIHVAGKLSLNDYRGRIRQRIEIEDAAKAAPN